jgi:hypothetical protein
MFNNRFSRKSGDLSKEAYWEKWEFFDLIIDLHEAEKAMSLNIGDTSDKFASSEQFRLSLEDLTDDIEGGNQLDLTQLWELFAPVSAWDDFMGNNGQDLGDRIFQRLDHWMKHNL